MVDTVLILMDKRHAKMCAEELYRNNKDEIYSVNMITVFFFCMKDGSRMFFLTPLEYVWWCKGKTYYIDGKKYHSGVEVQDERETKSKEI